MAPSASDLARKGELLRRFKAFAQRHGGVPGIREFLKESGAKKYLWDGHLWPSWRAFLAEAGYEPNELTQALPDDHFLRPLAILTRQYGRFPTVRELKYARTKDGTIPAEKTYRNRFRNQAAMIQRLFVWVEQAPEFADLLEVLKHAPTSEAQRTQMVRTEVGCVRLSESFVPPVIDCLPALASAHPEIVADCEARGIDPSVEFERRVAIAFRLLDLEVAHLGQGAGRVADGIARCRSQRWAVIFDAKLRRSVFALGTEDRKFREYIERHGAELARDGFDSIYFAVISSRFSDVDVRGAQKLVNLTRAKSVVLLEAAALRLLVELRMRSGAFDTQEQLQMVFSTSRVLTTDIVNKMKK